MIDIQFVGGRQKKQFIDQQDLKNQQEAERAVQQGRSKLADINSNFFDTQKLDQNFFIRKQNKHAVNEGQTTNFQEEIYKKQSHIQSVISQQSPSKQKKATQKKRRRKPLKNQNIFGSDQEQNEQQNQNQQRQEQTQQTNAGDQNTQAKFLQSQQKVGASKKLILQDEQSPVKKKLFKKQQNQDCSISHKSEDNKKKIQEQQQDQHDDFDQALKKKGDQEDQEEQKIFYLHKEINNVDKDHRKDFYYQSLPKNHVAYAYFKRFSSGLSQIYQLTGEDHRPLLFCQNQRGCIGCNYYISMTKQMDKNKPTYLGKLRGNAAGSTYFLYDDGIQPKNQIDRSKWRVTLSAIQYQSNFMGMNGPRKLKVTTPSAKLLEDADTFKLSQQQSLLSFKPPIITEYRNKNPKWNEKLKSYALNFGGRVKLASIKNFILLENSIAEQDQQQAANIIIFGKVDENTFSVEYRHPLSLMQAFGIVMSEFDFKINCE